MSPFFTVERLLR